MTITSIRKLDGAQSVEELARILGGVEITDTVRRNAEEMKEMALRTKNTSVKQTYLHILKEDVPLGISFSLAYESPLDFSMQEKKPLICVGGVQIFERM